MCIRDSSSSVGSSSPTSSLVEESSRIDEQFDDVLIPLENLEPQIPDNFPSRNISSEPLLNIAFPSNDKNIFDDPLEPNREIIPSNNISSGPLLNLELPVMTHILLMIL